jgi:CRISPR-associated endonuclease/helicase Cas3
MHILLVSQCEKKAILRTAKVLDAYAVRHGDRTWVTPITRIGLDALYRELRSRGTRQTAVACYVNDGARRLKLLWVVGRKGAFGPAGSVAVATKTGPMKDHVPDLSPAVRVACLLAECAGLIHDFGKYGQVFQRKLDSNTPLADPIRHEWISLQVLLSLLDGGTWEQGWNKQLRMTEYRAHAHGIEKGLQSVEAVLAFLVMSHHRLPCGQPGGRNSTVRTNIPGDEEYIRPEALAENKPNPFVSQPSPLAMKRIEHLLARIRGFELPDHSPEAMRAIASLARMALILADHHVSSIDKTQSEGQGPSIAGHPGAVFANTHNHNGTRLKNQELSWHLNHVGNEAGSMIQRMLAFRPPGLTGAAVDVLRQRSEDRFQWQNVCADTLEAEQLKDRLPTLVINIAGTGCGKTRMNMRAIAALRPPDSDGSQEPLRVATAMNLRTLTLQTRDAYAEQLELGPEQLACVLGSRIAVRLHDAGKRSAELIDENENEDENEPEDIYISDGLGSEPPPWLAGFMEKKPVLRPLIMSPVVVSTIDFLINAGEPHKQGNHGLAMLRMMHSDLVLDEIDAYDPKAMVAVARLVTASAMWGRHVIASSATLSPPVAKVLFDAFALGIQLHNVLDGKQTKWRQAIIDDRVAPLVTTCDTAADFVCAFNGHISGMMASMGRQRFRPAELQAVARAGGAAQGDDHIFDAIKTACARLHDRHAWTAPTNSAGYCGKISIGLVRMANIRSAIEVARRLAASLPHVRVCCYHSQVGLLQRWNIERILDSILTRKKETWAERTVQSNSVLEVLREGLSEGAKSISMIVVATPVEEIGRDHDFDWAVIEPSSCQSIVQTAGRVNRHRLVEVDSPNIAVLQFNRRECTKRNEDDPVFCRPGLESTSSTSEYGDHDLGTLVNWAELATAGQIDARLRYQTNVHRFAEADDASLSGAVRGHMKSFMKSACPSWLMKDTYLRAPLRDTNESLHEEWFIDSDGNYVKWEPNGKLGQQYLPVLRNPDSVTARHRNEWLVLSFDETIKLARGNDIRVEEATSVQVLSYGDSGKTLVHHDLSFGYCSEKNKS